MNLYTKFAILGALSLLGACSTGLSKDECLNASWQQIGFEDGAHGRSLEYIGRHRKSCAKVNVSPDFSAYKQGHKEGLTHWCVYDKGLAFGRRGGNYQGNCPATLEGDFLAGYEYGRKIHFAQQDVSALEDEVSHLHAHIEELENEKATLSLLLLKTSDTTEAERLEALVRLNEIPEIIINLEYELAASEDALFRAKRKLNKLLNY